MPPTSLPNTLTDHGYSSDVDGGAPVAVRMLVSGELGRSYLDFVADRVAWLDLAGWAERRTDGRVVIVAAGPEALVGALEMACLLGPIDTLVRELDLEAMDYPVPPGFVVRR